MTLTKKHFKAIAQILQNYNGEIPKDNLITDLCHYFRSENSNFDSSRFVEASVTIKEKVANKIEEDKITTTTTTESG